MLEYISKLASSLTPYVPGEQSLCNIKLNTNENAYGPSPNVIKAVTEAANGLNLYPDPESFAIREAVVEYLGADIKPENVFMGNGSDEVLAIAFMSFFHESLIAAPELTYSFYPVYAGLYRVGYEAVAMKSGFEVDVDRLLACKKPVILANPNAPTSLALPLSEIERMAHELLRVKRLLIIDEAYAVFGGESAVALTCKYENLLVVNTLSKSHALAGLRVGFAVGNVGLIEAMTRVKNCINSYPLDRLAQAGGVAALKDSEHFTNSRDKIIKTREWFSNVLGSLGYTVLQSSANFVFVSHPQLQAKKIFEALRRSGILVRYFDNPLSRDWLRITIGTQTDMEVLQNAMKSLTSSGEISTSAP